MKCSLGQFMCNCGLINWGLYDNDMILKCCSLFQNGSESEPWMKEYENEKSTNAAKLQ
jgi:hypothetical protein